MPLTRQQKVERVSQSAQDFSAATSVVFMKYDALTVTDAEALREQLHQHQARMRILPKRLLKRVMEQAGWNFDPTATPGQLAVVWGSDAVAPAKVLHTFAQKHENIQLVAGFLAGNMLSLAEVTALALLPSREQLLGKLVGTIANPMRGLVGVLSGVQRGTVQVLSAIAEKRKM